MSPVALGVITLVCVFGGALLGLVLQKVLPEQHLREDSRDVVKLVTGLIATLSALVLGLLIASSKGSYDAVGEALKQSAAKVIVVDRLLGQYGPDAAAARVELKREYERRISQLFGDHHDRGSQRATLLDTSSLGALEIDIDALVPTTDAQRALLSRMRSTVQDISQVRWLAFEQSTGSTPPLFLAVLVSWLVMMFASFGLFSPRNPTAICVLFLGALAVATAIFLIEEMNQPLGGWIAISSEPMRNALSVLGK